MAFDRLLTFKTNDPEEPVDRQVWAELYHARPSDDISVESHAQLYADEDDVFKVRRLGDVNYNLRDRFLDHNGNTREIRGVQEQDRRFYLLQARLI